MPDRPTTQVEVPNFVTKTTYAVYGEWGNGWYHQSEYETLQSAELAALSMRQDCLASAVVKVERKLIVSFKLPDKEKCDAAWEVWRLKGMPEIRHA